MARLHVGPLMLATALARAGAVPAFRPQLSIANCTTTPNLAWHFSGAGVGTSGVFVENATGLCVTYDPPTTNLVMDVCAPASAEQTFTIRPDDTFYSASRNLCWDVQYYGNVSGSVLGLYTCHPEQEWDLFKYDSASGRITNTQLETLCVSGAAPPVPLPSPEQLAWTRGEVSLMISYDLITQLTDVPNPQHFCIAAGGDAGFSVPPAASFNPSNDTTFTDSWMAAAIAVGANYTLLVASHCSGFLQWQSNVTLPNGAKYPYGVAQASAWRNGRGDVVEDYVTSSKAAGMGFGFYLTWNYNYLFNIGPNGIAPGPLAPGQLNITMDQYRALMLATMEEVWTRYPGQLTEIWFDGGENNVAMNSLIKQLQPKAIVTDGTQGPNYARLVGRESGFAPYPVWSTDSSPARDGSGDPAGRLFVPAEADTPIAANDAWFWKPQQKYRGLDELKAVYRNTVGANAVLELGVLPDNTGSIPSDQMALLQDLGDYIRKCHSPSAAVNSTAGIGVAITLSFPLTVVDRVIIQEDLSFGQLVQAFTVQALPAGGYDPVPVVVAEGQSIGHKRILYFASGPLPARAIIVTATALYPGESVAHWRNVAVYAPCE